MEIERNSMVLGSTDIDALCDHTKDYFSTLPDELILTIFGMLPLLNMMQSCAPVCKRWKDLCCFLCKKVNLNNEVVTLGTIAELLKCDTEHLSLRESFVDNRGPSLLNLVSDKIVENRRFSKLQYLHLSYAIIIEDILQDVLSVCSHLTYLNLKYLTLNDSICWHIVANKNLQELDLSFSSGLTPDGISCICQNCTQLKVLKLEETCLTEETLDTLSSNIPSSITTLNLNGNWECQDRHIQSITQRCRNIICLNIGWLYNLTSAGYTRHFVANKNLQELNLSYSSGLTPDGISRICQNFTQLKVLKLEEMCLTEETLDTLSFNIPSSITTLDLNGNWECQDRHIKSITQRCRNIIYLNIGRLDKLTLDSLVFIASNLKKIQYLCVMYCKLLLSGQLHFVVNKSLQVLNLSYSSGLTPDGISRMCQNFTQLVVLKLVDMCLTEETLDALSSNIPSSVTTLDLKGNCECRDRHIQSITQRCRNIICFDISGLYKLTPDSLVFIASNLENIQYLYIKRCKQILSGQFSFRIARSLKKLFIHEFEEDTADAIFVSNLKMSLPHLEIEICKW